MQENLKLHIDNSRLITNLELYKIIKDVIQLKLTSNQIVDFIESLKLIIKSEVDFESKIKNLKVSITKKYSNKESKIHQLNELINNNLFEDKHLYILKIAFNLIRYKGFILEKSKLISDNFRTLDSIHLMDFSYDYNLLLLPYSVRVAGALLIKLLFEAVENSTDPIYESLKADINQIKDLDSDIVLQIIYAESASQSIRSTSGNSYENRFEEILKANGIAYKSQCFDSKINSVEYDFKLLIKNKTIGVSVKRTLRERYKQNHEDVNNLDVDAMFLITLGIDLNEDKIKYITSKNGQYIFVASDLYAQKKHFINCDKVFPISQLSNELIQSMVK